MAPFTLEAFADESGIVRDEPYCVVAGYLGAPEEWQRFTSAWQAVLAAYHVEQIGFHSIEFFGNRSPYQGWSDGERDQFIIDLATVIDWLDLWPIGSAIERSAFNGFTYGERLFLTGGTWKDGRYLRGGKSDEPWFLAMQRFVVEAALVATTDAKVNYTFDLQDQMSGLAADTFRDLRTIYPGAAWSPSIGEMTFASRLDHPALQAADLLAYGFYSVAKRRQQINPRRLKAMEILVRKRDVYVMFEAETMEEMFSLLTPEDRQSIRATIKPQRPLVAARKSRADRLAFAQTSRN